VLQTFKVVGAKLKLKLKLKLNSMA
jgi:hypothetical protein